MLALLKGDTSVHVVPVEDRPIHIGRAPENDLAVVDRTVSRHHATVWNQGGKTYVRDHGTTNGSFLNEMRVRYNVDREKLISLEARISCKQTFYY